MQRAKTFWTSFSRAADWLYPAQCALCARLGEPPVCPVCESEMRPLEALEQKEDKLLSFRLSAFEYEGRAAQAVKRLKYSRATSLGAFMGSAVHSAANAAGVADRVVLPIPIHWSRRAIRGFNQAEMIAEPFANLRRGVLLRVKATASQAGLNAEQRRRNLTGAFEVRGRVDGQRVLLVDDVLTTGQTGRECAKVILAAGAIDVGLVTFAAEL